MIVDMHTHILPNIDDGARSEEESLLMLGMLENDGVTDVVLTPHFYYRNQSMQNFLDERQRAYEKLTEAYSGNIRLHLGVEAEFSYAKINYGAFYDLAIDKGKYILLELPFDGESAGSVLSRLERFIYDTDLVPVIAHIERYMFVRKDPGIVEEMINIGCLIQANAESVIKAKKGSLTDALLKHGQIHLLGSDCHNVSSRAPNLMNAFDTIHNLYGIEYLNILKNLSEDVIMKKNIKVSADVKIKKVFGSYK